MVKKIGTSVLAVLFLSLAFLAASSTSQAGGDAPRAELNFSPANFSPAEEAAIELRTRARVQKLMRLAQKSEDSKKKAAPKKAAPKKAAPKKAAPKKAAPKKKAAPATKKKAAPPPKKKAAPTPKKKAAPAPKKQAAPPPKKAAPAPKKTAPVQKPAPVQQEKAPPAKTPAPQPSPTGQQEQENAAFCKANPKSPKCAGGAQQPDLGESKEEGAGVGSICEQNPQLPQCQTGQPGGAGNQNPPVPPPPGGSGPTPPAPPAPPPPPAGPSIQSSDGCPEGSLTYLGQCVDQCPVGMGIRADGTCGACPAGTAEEPAVGVDGVCLAACPAGTVRGAGDQCVAGCPAGQELFAGQCVFPGNCPSGQVQYESGGAYQCAESCPAGLVERLGGCIGPAICGSQGGVVNGDQCLQSCPEGLEETTKGGCAISCPDGQVRVSDGQCAASCPSPLFELNGVCETGATCISQGGVMNGDQCLESCPDGTSRVGDQCLQSCPDGTSRVGNQCRVVCAAGEVRWGTQCVATGQCPQGEVSYEGQCAESCPDGLIVRQGICVQEEACIAQGGEVELNQYCVAACPDGEMRWGLNTCVAQCPGGAVEFAGRCVAGGGKCDEGQVRISTSDGWACVNSCPDGTLERAGGCVGSGICIAQDGVVLGDQCVEQCPAGQEAVNGSCIITCRAGQEAVDGACVIDCPEGELRSGDQCVAQCPTGQIIDGNACVAECPEGKVKAFGGNYCTVDQTCPNGQVYSGGQCVEEIGYEEYLSWCLAAVEQARAEQIEWPYGVVGATDEETCRNTIGQQCEEDYSDLNARACQERPCPDGQDNVNGQCVASCVEGSERVGAICQCSGGQVLQEGGVCAASCAEGTVLDRNGQCTSQCAGEFQTVLNGQCFPGPNCPQGYTRQENGVCVATSSPPSGSPPREDGGCLDESYVIYNGLCVSSWDAPYEAVLESCLAGGGFGFGEAGLDQATCEQRIVEDCQSFVDFNSNFTNRQMARFCGDIANPADGTYVPPPTAGGEQPPAEDQQPPAEGEQPPDSTQPPAEGEQPPPGTGTPPPAEGEQPPAEGEQPPAEQAPPDGTAPPPDTGTPPPGGEAPPPDTGTPPPPPDTETPQPPDTGTPPPPPDAGTPPPGTGTPPPAPPGTGTPPPPAPPGKVTKRPPVDTITGYKKRIAARAPIAIVIANARYRSKVIKNSRHAAGGAKEFVKFLRRDLRLPANRIVSRRDMRRGDFLALFGRKGRSAGRLKTILARAPASELIIYYSGRAMPIEDGNDVVLLTRDANLRHPVRTGYRLSELYKRLATLGVARIRLYLDTAFSTPSNAQPGPNAPAADRVRITPALGLIGKIIAGKWVIVSAGTGTQATYADPKAPRSAFTDALLDGLRGYADTTVRGNNNGAVTATELDAFLRNELHGVVNKATGGTQRPSLIGPASEILTLGLTPMSVPAAAPAQPQSGAVKPSFNCAKARAPAEKAICASPAIATLDNVMVGLYKKARRARKGAARNSLTARQRAWLGQRNACGPDIACLAQRYGERIQQLQ